MYCTPIEEARHPAQEQMLLEHLPTVRILALRIHRRLPAQIDIEDLVSAGVVGLMDALHKFDPDRKVGFGCYARIRIHGAILDSLRTLDWSPRNLRRQGRVVEKAIREATTKLGRSPDQADVAAEMKLGIGDYQQLLVELDRLKISTLNESRGEESGEEKIDRLPSRPEDDPYSICLQSEIKDCLADAMSRLPGRERLVLTLYYYQELTLSEIAQELGVVVSRVSQIRTSAMEHLRPALEELDGRPPLGGAYMRKTPDRATRSNRAWSAGLS